MRHIPFDNLDLPDGWVEKVDQLKQVIESAEPKDRKELINKNAKLWRDLKETLSEFSNGKCWYCETKEFRSDRVVDHFRPKNRVAERDDHPGYWWLAFDWTNYRYSCTFCNSLRKSEKDEPAGGKADHFPIIDEQRRACDPDGSIEDEFPYLLDPIRNGDTPLLTFTDDGRAVPCYTDDNSLHYERANQSIELFHLNHPEICEARYSICYEIKQLVKEGNRAFSRQEESADAALVGNESFEGTVRKLRKMVDKNAEYSRAARAILAGYKTEPWVNSMLEDSN